MNRQGYIRVMRALVNLIVVIMVEAGKVPISSATQVGENILKAITGGTGENKK
jgi:hypothetical protein